MNINTISKYSSHFITFIISTMITIHEKPLFVITGFLEKDQRYSVRIWGGGGDFEGRLISFCKITSFI